MLQQALFGALLAKFQLTIFTRMRPLRDDRLSLRVAVGLAPASCMKDWSPE